MMADLAQVLFIAALASGASAAGVLIGSWLAYVWGAPA